MQALTRDSYVQLYIICWITTPVEPDFFHKATAFLFQQRVGRDCVGIAGSE
jgi:hypothetical protein